MFVPEKIKHIGTNNHAGYRLTMTLIFDLSPQKGVGVNSKIGLILSLVYFLFEQTFPSSTLKDLNNIKFQSFPYEKSNNFYLLPEFFYFSY